MARLVEKGFKLKLAGFDEQMYRVIRNLFAHASIQTSKMTNLPDVILKAEDGGIVLVQFKKGNYPSGEQLKQWLHHFALVSPVVYFPESGQSNPDFDVQRNLWEVAGCKVYWGKSGKGSLVEWLKHLSEYDPSEIIAKVRVSDEGLTVWFADGAVAVVSIPELKRLAEGQEILWNNIRIGPDRTFISIGLLDGEDYPIPSDVLADYVVSEKEKRQKKYEKEARLTARNFGKRLRELRESMGLSQEELAKKIGKSRWTVIRIENGDYLPKVADLQNIARGLGRTLDEVLG